MVNEIQRGIILIGEENKATGRVGESPSVYDHLEQQTTRLIHFKYSSFVCTIVQQHGFLGEIKQDPISWLTH